MAKLRDFMAPAEGNEGPRPTMNGPGASAPHQLDVAIGHRIRQRRRYLGLSQQALAKSVGVTFQQIQKYERGANRVSFSRLLEIARVLRCSLSDLAQGLEAPSAPQLQGLNALLAREGALELLEAYGDIASRDLRRALLLHARALAELKLQAEGSD